MIDGGVMRPFAAMSMFLGVLCLLSPSAIAGSKPRAAQTQQLIVVTSESWASSTGELQRYEHRRGGAWVPVGEPSDINLGRRGMAWGLGLHETNAEGPQKIEGDGRSPAGIFELGTAFGEAKELPAGSQGYPYLHATGSSYCVEDTRSENYNRLVELSERELVPWRQRSPLMRPDGLFQWGIVVKHNYSPTMRNRGSCAFLHVWRGHGVSTAGCTSMAPDEILSLVRWLDVQKSPRLVQLPREVYESLRGELDLP